MLRRVHQPQRRRRYELPRHEEIVVEAPQLEGERAVGEALEVAAGDSGGGVVSYGVSEVGLLGNGEGDEEVVRLGRIWGGMFSW